MARHGIPEVLHSDNGPEFSTMEFSTVCQTVSIPACYFITNFFQTNGLVKRTLQTVKKLVKKVYKENKDPYLAILEL